MKIKSNKVIISVGNFIYRKGFDILYEANKLLKNRIDFYIVGGKKEEFQKLINDNIPDNFHIIDFVEKKKLFEYYKAADLFVLPTREDIWGLVVNEAMANGLPVITTNKCISGLELIKDGKNGYIIESNNPKQLAEKIEKYFDKNEYYKMSNINLEIIRKYTYSNMVEIYLNVFNNIDKDKKYLL